MREHLDIGIAGEQCACTHLEEQGYIILEKNWRYGRDEVDIIASMDETIVFVEVKTRTSTYAGEPYMAVGAKKQRFMVRAADAFMKLLPTEQECRFDVIGIVMSQKNKSLEHVQDAFYPRI